MIKKPKDSNRMIAKAIVICGIGIACAAVFVGVFLFASNAMASPPVHEGTLLSTDMAWDGQPIGNQVTVVKTIIKAGQSKPVHQHQNVWCGYIAKGELTITKVNGEAAIFLPGEAYCEVLGVDHYGTAGRGSDVHLISFEVIPKLANF